MRKETKKRYFQNKLQQNGTEHLSYCLVQDHIKSLLTYGVTDALWLKY